RRARVPAAGPQERLSATPVTVLLRSCHMPEPDNIQPAMDTNGAPAVAEPRNDAAAKDQGPGTTGPELRAAAANPAADPATSPEQCPFRLPSEPVGRYRVLGGGVGEKGF